MPLGAVVSSPREGREQEGLRGARHLRKRARPRAGRGGGPRALWLTWARRLYGFKKSVAGFRLKDVPGETTTI